MYDSKLIKLYLCLDRKELEGLHKWLRSPLHNSDDKLIYLFDFLASRRKKTSVSLDKKKAFRYIYPKQEYDDLLMRRLMSKSLKNVKEFVEFLMYKKDTIARNKKLIEYLEEHSLTQMLEQTIKDNEQKIAKQAIHNSAYYYNSYQLEQSKFDLTYSKGRMRETNLQAIFDDYSGAFIIEILRYAGVASSHQNLYNIAYEIPLLEAVLEAAQRAPYNQIPAVQIYYEAYMTQATWGKQYFENLKKYLIEYKDLLPQHELRNLYTMAINYCIKNINSDESQIYMQQVWELYEQGTRDEILLDKGTLSRFTYKNTVTAALKLQKFDWVEQYIEAYSPYVDEKYRKSYTHYNIAKLYFAKGNYQKVMQLLLQVEYDDIFLNMDAKTMLLKIYYQDNSIDALYSLFHSFTIFLQRKSILGYHRQNYLNIIKMTKKLAELIPSDKAEKNKLKIQIQELQPLTEREWLLFQIK